MTCRTLETFDTFEEARAYCQERNAGLTDRRLGMFEFERI